MVSHPKKVNPHCVVPGCRTKRPHSESPATQEVMQFFSDSAKLTMAVKLSIGDLIQSVEDDLEKGRFFAYHTRARQVEELYYRLVYVLFIADERALPHILSGNPPNGFAEMWKAVNKAVLDGRGALDSLRTNPSGEVFTAMDMLNQGAHASFAAIAVSIAFAHSPDSQAQITRHVEYWKKLYIYLNYMEGMFKAGKSKADVLVGVRNLHKPASAWKPRSTETNP